MVAHKWSHSRENVRVANCDVFEWYRRHGRQSATGNVEASSVCVCQSLNVFIFHFDALHRAQRYRGEICDRPFLSCSCNGNETSANSGKLQWKWVWEREKKKTQNYGRDSDVDDDNDDDAQRQAYTLHMQIAAHEEHTDSYKLIIQPRNAHNRLKV